MEIVKKEKFEFEDFAETNLVKEFFNDRQILELRDKTMILKDDNFVIRKFKKKSSPRLQGIVQSQGEIAAELFLLHEQKRK